MMNVMMANNHSKNPFADYLWMGDMDHFDQQVEAEFEEEIKEEMFIKSCIEQLLDEEEEQTVYFGGPNGMNGFNGYANEQPHSLIEQHIQYQNANQQVPHLNGHIGVLDQNMHSMYLGQENNKEQSSTTKSSVNGSNPSQDSFSTISTDKSILSKVKFWSYLFYRSSNNHRQNPLRQTNFSILCLSC